MRKLRTPLVVLLGVSLFLLGSTRTDSNPIHAQNADRYFPQTGHTVKGAFLTYWDAHGGLAQQGYPISDEFQERNARDGKRYMVQYFERAVFEQHSENAGTPYNVLLGLVGSVAYSQRYGAAGAPGQQPNLVNPLRFAQTGHVLGGPFRAYWESHGGLAQQGYPISDEFQEQDVRDGKTYTVQYFERAVFERHPENAGTPYVVLLSQLGAARYAARYAAPTAPTPTPDSTLPIAQTTTADLAALDMVSDHEGWAVGTFYPYSASPQGALVHYYDGRWTAVDSPALVGNNLRSVSMVSADEGWAVGSGGIIHYSGGQWHAETGFLTSSFNAVEMVSADEGWVAGGHSSPTILHYYKGRWTDGGCLGNVQGSLESLSIVPTLQGWAVGAAGFLRQDGQCWLAPSSRLPSLRVPSVYMVSADDGWVVDRNNQILHYSGAQWTPVTNPVPTADNPVGLNRVRMVNPDEGWIVGGYDLILHYSNGVWSHVPNPAGDPLNDVAALSSHEAWAVGQHGTILHYQNGAWDYYRIPPR